MNYTISRRREVMFYNTYKACHYLDCKFFKHSKRNLQKLFRNLSSLPFFHSGVKRENFVKFIRKPTEQSTVVLSHPTLITLLKNCKSVSEQIEVFQSYVRLTAEDISKRISLCNTIENILKSQFPNCSVHLVGSSISGLGLKGSDVDLSFQFSASDISQNSAVSTSIISNVDVARGNISLSNFSSLTVKQQLLFLQRILKQHEVAVASTIIPGHHPILNFKFHDLGCDLSINNWSAFQSTKLMKICAKLDYRIMPLFQLLSYWGKRSNLIGGPMKFKSYSLFLMVVFFLQTKHNPILPSIQDIFIKSELLENLKNWSYDVSQLLEKFPPSYNATDIETLFREFFFFYSNFNFSSVICTLNTKLVDAKSYTSEYPEFELSTISIQDPLDCSQNVTTGVNWKYSKKLIKSLFSTCEVYHKCSPYPSSDEKWGLAAILDLPSKGDSSESVRVVEIEIPLKKYEFCNSSDTSCFNSVSEKVCSLLREGLLFQCSSLDPDSVLPDVSERDGENSKNEPNGENPLKEKGFTQDSDTFLISRILCSTSDSWSGRSNYSSQNIQDEENNFFDHQREISKKILKNKKDIETFQFICECYGTYKENTPYLNMTLSSVNEKVFIPKLRIFLKEYILNYSRIYL